MGSQRVIESLVGLFILAAIAALVILAFKVSGLTSFFREDGYTVTANFDDIGGLKLKAPVKVGGVVIGEVSSVTLDPATFKAIVKMNIYNKFNDIPSDSSASILTAGLLGDNYIELTPMYSQEVLKNGSVIEYTHPAMILERLIGQFLFRVGGGQDSSKTKTDADSGNAPPAQAKPLNGND
jgi:phospholipid/cholesterol/gamma-HCH transport system substrate-binding protein